MSLWVGFNAADIVDTEPAIGDNLLYFLNTNYAGIIYFKGATGDVTAVVNCEDKRVKNGSVCRIERTVDEDVVLVRGHASVIPIARWERVCAAGLACVPYFSFLRLHQPQITIFRRLGKLAHQDGRGDPLEKIFDNTTKWINDWR